MLETQKKTWILGSRLFWDQCRSSRFAFAVLLLFTRILQTINYHFKAGQVWFLVHKWKQGKKCLADLFNFMFAEMCLRCRKSATLNQAPLLLNFWRLSTNLHLNCRRGWHMQILFYWKNQRLKRTWLFLTVFNLCCKWKVKLSEIDVKLKRSIQFD